MKDLDNLDYFDEFTETDMVLDPCYTLAVYDLSQMKLKPLKVYERAVTKLLPEVSNPGDDDIIRALFLAYWDKPTGSIHRKLERLHRQGLIKL